MDDEYQHEAPPSPIHLDHFHHQGPPVTDPNLTVVDIARLHFPINFLFENAYNIKIRMEAKFQPTIDWMQFPLDIEEEEVTCPSSMHRGFQVASITTELDPSIGIEGLPPPKRK